jgi:hypothetical protein
LAFTWGDVIKRHTIQLPAIVYRGVWTAVRGYEPGDSVTWRGSLWMCLRATSAKPDEASSDWQLAVKRGRNGS